jgi:predicted RND superfamily exporter protein
MMKYMQRFALIMVVAIFLVFGVMASLFESFKDPFIVIFTIPLSVIGIVAIYLVTGDKLNIITAVGLLVLMGVIVNNGIVLVDYTNMLRKRGYSLRDACITAAGNRLRPILMSTLTTVIGLVPMAFSPGEGSEMTGPIGKTVFGGLSVGTLMTLFLMPTIYYILNRGSDRWHARAAARREGVAAGLTRKQMRQQHAGAASVATPVPTPTLAAQAGTLAMREVLPTARGEQAAARAAELAARDALPEPLRAAQMARIGEQEALGVAQMARVAAQAPLTTEEPALIRRTGTIILEGERT